MMIVDKGAVAAPSHGIAFLDYVMFGACEDAYMLDYPKISPNNV